MIRLFFMLALVASIALGLAWLGDRPSVIELTFQGYRYETSLFVGVGFLVAISIGMSLLFWLINGLIHLPQSLARAHHERRKTKGMEALTCGLLAVSAGEVRLAQSHAQTAARLIPEAPLALLLQAQAHQIAGQSEKAAAIFSQMMELPETRLLALRGLHGAARQRGEYDAALSFAAQAQKLAPASWATQAILDHYARHSQWERAIAVLESAYGHKLIDKATFKRQKAVLLTAWAQDDMLSAPEEALKYARQALKLAPDLVPACTLTARLLLNASKIHAAAKVLEASWQTAPHPDIASLYVDLRSGDAAQDRLQRAQKLLALSPDSPDARLAIAHAAIDARDFNQARDIMLPLISYPVERPTRKTCLAMARLEDERQNGSGLAREWLARAARAPHDPAWIADGMISDQWAPLSPITGKIDAFVWQTPAEQLSSPIEPLPTAPIEALAAPASDTSPAAAPSPAPAAAILDADASPTPAPKDELPSAQINTHMKMSSKTVADAPIKGLDPDHLRHFTAPDDPGPEHGAAD